uniref:hypothetical protein n=1 Tax=Aureimonas sp. AU40 TaxID=1637747 RepID=UPI00155DA850|nr:hypothetical protein [Aureimonas sp. AU40]
MKPGKRENKPGKRENRGGQVSVFKKEFPSKNKKKQEKTGALGKRDAPSCQTSPPLRTCRAAPEGCETATSKEGERCR